MPGLEVQGTSFILKRAADRFRYLFPHDRFLNIASNAHGLGLLFIDQFAESGANDNRDAWPDVQELLGHVRAGQTGHGLVGNDQVEPGGVGLKDL